jgi:CubicO group peptidase (beta-lactamase class C family)
MSLATFLVNSFDDLANQALKQWQVPGMALSIIHDDQVIFAKGYGVRRVGEPMPVDERTVFGIGSNTKSFTSAALGVLVSERKMDWDDPIARYLPEIRFDDPWVTREVTVRDLLSHRTGLPRGSEVRMEKCKVWDSETHIRRVLSAKPGSSFRSQFEYSNTVFELAGRLVPAVTGNGWAEHVRRRIFEPLGMTASSTNVNGLGQIENLAAPHAQIAGKLRVIPRLDIGDNPAGSINSNALDMAQWVRLNLNQGTYQANTLISGNVVSTMHAPQMIIHKPEETELVVIRALDPPINFWTYGLGWFVLDYRGRKMVMHGGQIDGNSSIVAMLPEENLGIVVLTNIHDTLLHAAISFLILDAYLGVAERDWNKDFLNLAAQFAEQEKAATQKIMSARVANTQPSLALEKYAGAYSDDVYGKVIVVAENDKLVVQYGIEAGDLEHWHYDTFRAHWRNPLYPAEFVTFTLDALGKANQVKIERLAEFTREK